MKIRTAEPSDLSAVVAILNQAIRDRRTAHLEEVTVDGRRAWFELRDGRRPILVAEESGEIVGWAGLGDYRPGRAAFRHTAEISYFVHEGHRRRGHGRRLVRECLARCPALDIRTVVATVLESNRASAALLESLGFERWAHLPRVADFDGREDSHVYYGLHVG